MPEWESLWPLQLLEQRGFYLAYCFRFIKMTATPYKDLVMGLFTASMLGLVIANRSFISGAAGGCQAEVGSATAMAAGTIVELKGGHHSKL